MYTGIVGCVLGAGAVVGAPPLPAVVVVLTGVGELGLAELALCDGSALSEIEHGLALGEADAFVAEAEAEAVAVASGVAVAFSPPVLESDGEAEAVAVAAAVDVAAAEGVAAVCEGDDDGDDEGEAEPVASDGEAVGVFEHAGDAASDSAEAGSTSAVP